MKILMLTLLAGMLAGCNHLDWELMFHDTPHNLSALTIISKALNGHGISTTYSFIVLPDPIPETEDLNASFALAGLLSGQYKQHGLFNSISLTWNRGDSHDGGCGGNGSADYIYVGLPNEWTDLQVAKKILHEVGHFCGLGHSSYLDSVMGPNILDLSEPNYSTEEWVVMKACTEVKLWPFMLLITKGTQKSLTS